jgi:mono/diheme cytochrome c family protein
MASLRLNVDAPTGRQREHKMARSRGGLAAIVAVSALLAAASVAAQQPEPGPEDWWGPRTKDWERMWPEGTKRDRWDSGRMGVTQNQRMLRHWTFMSEEVPDAYRGAVSPLEVTDETVAEGATLYAANCASCHGAIGFGDGAEGLSLVPSPALLSYLVHRPLAGDAYLMWAIAEGGVEFGTEMPAFKGTLTEEEIWTIITFMRAGFPATGAE